MKRILISLIPSAYLISKLDLYNINPLYPVICLLSIILSSFAARILLSIFRYHIFLMLSVITFIFLFLPLYHPSNYVLYGVVLISAYIGIVLYSLLYRIALQLKLNRYHYR